MPRGPRIDGTGLVHHVTFRGIERREIFSDDADREELLRRVDLLVPALGFGCFAWALMPNHAHFVLQTGSVQLPRLMQRLLTGYAMHFNRRCERAGHLFQNRYWSRPLGGDLEELAAVTEYVNRNPLRGGLVADEQALLSYPWCGAGHAARIGRRRLFEGCAARFEERDPDKVLLESLIADACAVANLAPEVLRSARRSRAVARVREVVCEEAILGLGIPASRVAMGLGVGCSAVSSILTRLERRDAERRGAREEMKERP